MMRNAQQIKRLGKAAIDSNGNVSEQVVNFALKKLTKKELKVFLNSLKKKYLEQTVIVRYEGNLSADIKKGLDTMFKNKNIKYEKNDKLGGGIEIIDNDMVVNYTISGLINNKLKSIKL